jgi:hypothetical protein
MGKRIYLLVALFLALAISGGIYAYAFTTAGGLIGISEPSGDVATTNATATQPNWNSVLTPISDTYDFRPNAAGDDNSIDEQYPTEGEHWDKVSENVSDDDSTYVASNAATWREDLYNMTDHSTQTAAGTIDYVDVYLECRVTFPATQNGTYVHIKTNGAEHNAPSENLSLSYESYTYGWDLNPETSSDWTWDEIDALQIGLALQRPATGYYARCTQVYAEVGFEAPPLIGNTPTGNLFDINPHADYSGDLLVRVYLVNTDNLTKAYKYLNMNLYLEGSLEAGKTPNYRVLSLENGVASFSIDGATSGPYTLSVSGGDYRLTSRDPNEWAADYTVTPELYCEVTQR